MGCVERKQREKEQVRQSILDAALKIAVEEGWHALTIRKIADAIEYTPPIVYEHFENKEELIQELFLSGFRELQKGYDLKNQSETDPKKIIMSLSLNHWDFAFKHKDLYQLMFSLERPIPNEEIKTGIRLIKMYSCNWLIIMNSWRRSLCLTGCVCKAELFPLSLKKHYHLD